MIKYLVLMPLVMSCNTASLRKDIESKDAIFKYSNNRKSFIEYPRDPVFLKDSFDLKSLSIHEFESYYIFTIEIGEDFKNDWYLPGGWDIQIFDIYLNLGKGNHIQCLKNRKAKIEEGWDKAIVISPLKSSDVKREIVLENSYVYDDFSSIENLANDVIVAHEKYVQGNCIYIKILKSSLENLSIKGIQVFSMGINLHKNGNTIREVNEFANHLSFGGGSSLNNNPNLVDILGNISQLKNYKNEGSRISFSNIKLIPIKEEHTK